MIAEEISLQRSSYPVVRGRGKGGSRAKTWVLVFDAIPEKAKARAKLGVCNIGGRTLIAEEISLQRSSYPVVRGRGKGGSRAKTWVLVFDVIPEKANARGGNLGSVIFAVVR